MNRRGFFAALGSLGASNVVGVESLGQIAAHALRTRNYAWSDLSTSIDRGLKAWYPSEDAQAMLLHIKPLSAEALNSPLLRMLRKNTQ